MRAFTHYFHEKRNKEREGEMWKEVLKSDMKEEDTLVSVLGMTHGDLGSLNTKVRFEVPPILDAFRAKLSIAERIFFTLEVSHGGFVSRALSILITMSILISCVLWIIASLPEYHKHGEACKASRAMNNDFCHELSTCFAQCEPLYDNSLESIERVCVIIFTIEVAIRLMCVHRVRTHLTDEPFIIWLISAAGQDVLDAEDVWGVGEPDSGGSENENQLPDTCVFDFMHEAVRSQDMGYFKKTVAFMMTPGMLLDIFSVVPYYIELMISPDGVPTDLITLQSLRTLRFLRVLRIFKLAKQGRTAEMLQRVVKRSMSMMFVLTVLVVMTLFISGTLVWIVEKGQWLPPNHPVLESIGIHNRSAFVRNEAQLSDDPSWGESP